MRSVIRSIGIAGGLVILAGAQNASAQIDNAVDFSTSFPFTVGSTTVPAGSYTIRPDDDNPQILQLSGERLAVFFDTTGTQARETNPKTEVVFKRYGDTYLLKDIWVAGSDTGYESVVAESERHMAKRDSSPIEQRVAAKKKVDTSSKR